MTELSPFEKLAAYCVEHKLHFWNLVAEIEEAYWNDCFPPGRDLLKFRLRGGRTPACKVKVIKRTWTSFPWQDHGTTRVDATNAAIEYFFSIIEGQDD